ncbi:MAG TPA: FecR domain-containing protein [Saprospiraceae bacterium]|nr:FecR domain-containing protein [Saprospiraceae bacterium]HMP22668.1 FecR domain-containing protein [Saprospiraceae bacterium]
MQETERLLEKLKKGDCSAAELRKLRALLKAKDVLADWLDQDLEQTKYTPDAAQSAMLWDKIATEIAIKEPKVVPLRRAVRIRKLAYRWAGVAAALLLTFFAWQYFKAPAPVTTVVVESATQEPRTLPDGSVVWLNKGSQLSYLSDFEKDTRIVTLTGEAFFEVKKDTKRPFVVKTGTIQTRVLGTAFNVKAYGQDDLVEVALVSGQVQVEALRAMDTIENLVTLAPGEQFKYDLQQHNYELQVFENDRPYAWRNGIIYFDGADVREVAQTLERWYDVRFTLHNDILMSSELVSRYDTKRFRMQEVLNHITQVTDYRFEYLSEGEYLIRPK